jgi:hypothetical protein
MRPTAAFGLAMNRNRRRLGSRVAVLWARWSSIRAGSPRLSPLRYAIEQQVGHVGEQVRESTAA